MDCDSSAYCDEQWPLERIEEELAKSAASQFSTLTRREFLGVTGAGAAALGLAAVAMNAGGPALAQGDAKSKVVFVRDDRAKGTSPNVATVVQEMLDKAMFTLTGEQERKSAWGKLFKNSDIVGLKINCQAGATLFTRPEVVKAIVAGLMAAGVKEDNIVVYDRHDDDLQRCGYTINLQGAGVKYCGTLPSVGYSEPVPIGEKTYRLSKILTQITALVNVPVLKTTGGAGVSLALKNHYGSINKPSEFHDPGCASGANISAVPAIKDKTRLVVCDALRPLYDQGPRDDPRFRRDLGGLLLSTDPVAHDAAGREVLQQIRKGEGLGDYRIATAKMIEAAAQLGLGNAEWSRIEFTQI